MNFKVRLLQQATKIQQKSMKIRMFFGTSFLQPFGKDFGRVLGGQNPWFSVFLREKMESKNKMIFGRLKNRILRPQEQIADEVRRYVRTRGKELRMGGRHFRKESWAHNLELVFWSLNVGAKRTWQELGGSFGTLGSPFGRRRMCCARTAALQVGKEKPKWMPTWISCSNQYNMHFEQQDA